MKTITQKDGTIKLAEQSLPWLKENWKTLLHVTRPGCSCVGGSDYRKLIAITAELERRGYGIKNGKVVKQIAKNATKRLEQLRKALRSENISYGELHELQSLAAFIAPGDVELLEAAGVPEGGVK